MTLSLVLLSFCLIECNLKTRESERQREIRGQKWVGTHQKFLTLRWLVDIGCLILWKWVVIFLTLSSSQLRGPQKVKLGGNDLYQVWVGKSKPVLNLGWFELVKFGLGSAFDSDTRAEFGLD